MVALRLPGPPLKDCNKAVGCLFFNDGSQKCLAAFVVWLALLLAIEQPEITQEDLQHPQVVTLVASLLQIRTVYKASTAGGDAVDSAIARVVKQNIDSKVQPVSSLTWSSILISLGDGISLDAALARYNDHPEVKAFEGEGTGSISLEGKKRQAGSLKCRFQEAFVLSS